MTDVFDADAWISAQLGSPRRGTPLDDPGVRTRPADLVAALGSFLSMVHRRSPAPGPDRSPRSILEAVTLGAARRSADVELIAEGARALCPDDPDTVVITFGGLRLDGLEIDDGVVCGWRVGEYAGVGDPAWDIASVASQLAELIGPEAPALLIEHYDGPAPGLLRLEFWSLIDRLR